MKRIFLVKHGSAQESFEVREEPDPKPSAGEVLIEVEASGLNFADVMARRGLYPEAPKPPSVLGYEIVGRVTELGTGTQSTWKGKRVVAFTRFGGYASKVCVPEIAIAEIPEKLGAGEATALGTQFTTAYFAAEEMVRLQPGDHVLIHAAAGGVGIALVQLAKLRGCRVAGTASSPKKLEFLSKLGVDWPINYAREDFGRSFRNQSGGRAPDVIFDSIGGHTFKKGLQLLGAGGRIVSFGVAEMVQKGPKALGAVRSVFGFGWPHPIALLSQSKGIVGVNMLAVADQRPDVLSRCLRNVAGLVQEGRLTPHLGGEFPAQQIAEAHALLESRHSIGKVALRW